MKELFCKDPSVESWLTLRGYRYIYTVVDLGQIDVESSRKNKARTISIDNSAVQQYSDAMKNGATFPAIVLVSVRGKSRLVIASGNHRHASAIAIANGDGNLMAYVVQGECSDEDFDVISKGLNAIESSIPVPAKVRIEQAVAMVLNRGMTIQDASRNLSVSMDAVKDHVQARRVIQAAAAKGIVLKDKPVSIVQKIERFSDNEPVFNALCSYVAKRNITGAEMDDLIKIVKMSKTEASKLRVIQDSFDAGVTKTASKANVAIKPIRADVLRSISRLENILNGRDSFPQIQLDSSERLEVAARWKALSKKMISVLSNGSAE